MKILKELKNQDVINMFAKDSFPKDKKTTFGTENVKIHKVPHGWSLKNYNTLLAVRPEETNEVYINKQKYSVTTSIIQNKIRASISDYKEVTEEELNNIAETGNVPNKEHPYQDLEHSEIFENIKKSNNKLIEKLFTENKDLLTEKEESQVLRDLFTKIVSYTGFPTVVNSRNFIKALMFLLDKWASFIDNKEVAKPEEWEIGGNGKEPIEKNPILGKEEPKKLDLEKKETPEEENIINENPEEEEEENKPPMMAPEKKENIKNINPKLKESWIPKGMR